MDTHFSLVLVVVIIEHHRVCYICYFMLCFISQPEEALEPPSALVPFLQKYADPRNKNPSVRLQS